MKHLFAREMVASLREKLKDAGVQSITSDGLSVTYTQGGQVVSWNS